MFSLRKPTDEQIRAYLTEVSGSPFTYQDVECTRSDRAPLRPGWNRDQERVLLGRGRGVFGRAREAIRQWRMFPPSVATLCWRDCPIETGQTVGVVYRARPVLCWMLFPATIVYVIDECDHETAADVQRFGFAYGTIADHPEMGEERFLVEWNQATDEVWYDLLAISRPRHWLARIGYPYTRFEQARFRRLSGLEMATAVQSVTAEQREPIAGLR